MHMKPVNYFKEHKMQFFKRCMYEYIRSLRGLFNGFIFFL